MSTKSRTTVSLSPEIYEAALRVGEKENRDFSNLVEVAIEEFLRVRGELPSEGTLQAELIALANEVGLDEALQTLRRRLRRGKAAA